MNTTATHQYHGGDTPTGRIVCSDTAILNLSFAGSCIIAGRDEDFAAYLDRLSEVAAGLASEIRDAISAEAQVSA